MRQSTGKSYHRWLAGMAAVIMASLVSACSGSTTATGDSSGVSCANYVIHTSGIYHDEVWVRVSVSNSTAEPRRYAVDVALSVRGGQPGATPVNVTVNGLVAANSSAELGRKVLTTDIVQRCRVTRLSKS
jgi:hypothetical protein